jgi:hypothetical protein
MFIHLITEIVIKNATMKQWIDIAPSIQIFDDLLS